MAYNLLHLRREVSPPERPRRGLFGLLPPKAINPKAAEYSFADQELDKIVSWLHKQGTFRRVETTTSDPDFAGARLIGALGPLNISVHMVAKPASSPKGAPTSVVNILISGAHENYFPFDMQNNSKKDREHPLHGYSITAHSYTRRGPQNGYMTLQALFDESPRKAKELLKAVLEFHGLVVTEKDPVPDGN